MSTPLTIGLVSISDRASQGVYEDKGLPALKDWLTRTVTTPMVFETRLIADEQEDIEATLKDLDKHPIPEDHAMRELVERAWTAYQQEQGNEPQEPPAITTTA